MKSKFLTLSVLALSLVGCKSIKEIQQVPGATLKMGETTNALKAGTERVEVTSNDLRYISEQLKELSKAGIGSEMRDENFKRMQESKTLNKKLLHATKYMESFDYQLWGHTTDKKIPDHILSEAYGKHAVLELGMTLPEVLQTNHPKLSALKKSDNMENFYAMAATLHKVNMFQKVFRTENKIAEQNMLDYIEAALKKSRDLKAGLVKREELSEVDQEVLKVAPLMRYTLKIRYKFLPLIALGRISHVNDGLITKIKMLLAKWSPEFAGDEDESDDEVIVSSVEDAQDDNVIRAIIQKVAKKGQKKEKDLTEDDLIDSSNPAQIAYATQILDYAIQTRNFGRSIGLTAKDGLKLDKKVRKIFENLQLNFSEVKGDDNTRHVQAAQLEEINKFSLKLDELLERGEFDPKKKLETK